MAKKKPLPYWISGGTEYCELCSNSYVLQAEYRCAACDRGVCDECVVIDAATGEVVCSECRAADGEEG
ncbi:MAG TPA: hypothetical protein VF771_16955 [Longimicrobiaceae bacterium]